MNWWRCPNEPPCSHGKVLHDVEEYDGDGTDTCCVDGCECGRVPAMTRSSSSPVLEG